MFIKLRSRFQLVYCAALIISCLNFTAFANPIEKDWGFSRVSKGLCSATLKAQIAEFPSPDTSKKIIISYNPNENPKISVEAFGQKNTIDNIFWPCPEFGWSPNSEAFFLTFSEGGAIGNFEVLIYYPSRQGFRVISPISQVNKDFRKNYPLCFEREEPNFAGINWLPDSGHLLIAAEVQPHTNCDSMGTFTIYEIKLPEGEIIRKFDQLESKKRYWDWLGPELKNSDDQCIRVPKSCWIPQLHPK